MNFQGSDILTAKNLSKADIERIMEVAEGFLPYAKKEKQSDQTGNNARYEHSCSLFEVGFPETPDHIAGSNGAPCQQVRAVGGH